MKRKTKVRPIIARFYKRFLIEEDSAAFIRSVSEVYTISTLTRLAGTGGRISRRAAVLAIGFLGDFESNPVLGMSLRDTDRGVRMLAEHGIQSVWCRDGNTAQRLQLGTILRLNMAARFEEAIDSTSQLIAEAPAFAEVWHQRAIANYNLGRLVHAVDDCRQALEYNPYHFAAAAGLGRCLLEYECPLAALDAFRRAVKLNPSLERVRAQIRRLERELPEPGS